MNRGDGGSRRDVAHDIACGPSGDVTMTGQFTETLDFGGGPLTATGYDWATFVVKFQGLQTNVAFDRTDGPHVLAIEAFPNPSRHGTTLMFQSPGARTVRAMIVDATGRVVRDMGAQELAPGANPVFWDGTDNMGRSVGKGVYFTVVRPNGLAVATKVLVLR